jgi:hypothetical protein
MRKDGGQAEPEEAFAEAEKPQAADETAAVSEAAVLADKDAE